MSEEILEVCCQCYEEGVESGELEGDVWCPNCENWISRSLILPKSEVLRLKKEEENMKRYYVSERIVGVKGISVSKEERDGTHTIIKRGFKTKEEAQKYADELNKRTH